MNLVYGKFFSLFDRKFCIMWINVCICVLLFCSRIFLPSFSVFFVFSLLLYFVLGSLFPPVDMLLLSLVKTFLVLFFSLFVRPVTPLIYHNQYKMVRNRTEHWKLMQTVTKKPSHRSEKQSKTAWKWTTLLYHNISSIGSIF